MDGRPPLHGHPLSWTQADQARLERQEELLRQVYALFGVPPEMLGMVDDDETDTSEEEEEDSDPLTE